MFFYGTQQKASFFLKENCGGVPHSISDFFISINKRKLYKEGEKLTEVHLGGRKDKKNNKRAIQLYLAIGLFGDGEIPSLLRDEDAPAS